MEHVPHGPKVDARGFTLDEARMEDLRQIYRETEIKLGAGQVKEACLDGARVLAGFTSALLVFAACVLFSERMPAWGGLSLYSAAAGFISVWWLCKELEACQKAVDSLQHDLRDLERRTALSPTSLRSSVARPRNHDFRQPRDRSRKRPHRTR